MKKPHLLVLLILLTGACILLYLTTNYQDQILTPKKKLSFKDLREKTSLGTTENPFARLEYETRMLIDPKTGKIPNNIRNLELQFARKLPVRRNSKNKNTKLNTLQTLTADNWTLRGPFNVGGRTRAVEIDITNEQVLLAGAVSGGVWRSNTQGESWQKITNPSSIHSVTCITQDVRPGKEHIWYYATGELQGNSASGGFAPYRGDGVFKSIDGGNSFELLPATSTGDVQILNSPFNYTFNMITNHTNLVDDEVYVAALGGILQSKDGGDTWGYVLGDVEDDIIKSLYSDIDITSSGVLYAAISQASLPDENTSVWGIFRSVDGNKNSWVNITPPMWPKSFDRTVIATSKYNENIVYFMVDSNPNTLWKYTYLFGDGSGAGGKWENLSNNIPRFGGLVGDYNAQSSYNMLIKTHPNNANVIFLGGTNLYRSTNGFNNNNNTAWIGGYTPTNDGSKYPNHHPDQHAITFFPSNPDRMLSGHDGGVSITENNLADSVLWNDLNSGYVTSQFYTLAINQSPNNNILWGGLQDNGTVGSFDYTQENSWGFIAGGDGGYCAINEDDNSFYLSFQNSQVLKLNINYKLELVGFRRIDPPGAGEKEGQEYLFINPFVLDPANTNRMYLAGGDRIWRNINLSQIELDGSFETTNINWFDISKSSVAPPHQISALNISTNPQNILYFGTTNGDLYKVTEAHTTEAEVEKITNQKFPDNAYISCIALDPTNADNILVVFSNYSVESLFYSNNGGVTFSAVGGNLEKINGEDELDQGPSVRWAEIVPKSNGNYIYIVGTSTGLYSTTSLEDSETVWGQEGAETIGNVVVTMVKYRASDGTIAAATHGNGVYTNKVSGILSVSPQMNINLSLNQNYPNPFQDITYLRFSIPHDGKVTINVINHLGQTIATIANKEFKTGTHELFWEGTTANGFPLPSGNYLLSMEFEGNRITRRATIIR